MTEPLHNSESAGTGAETSACEGVSVLLVDDDPSARLTMAMVLRKRGCQVDEVPGGREALERLERGTYQWIISDVRMPEMDGLTLAKRIRARWPKSRILLVSAFCHADDIDATDIDGFFEKPLDPTAFCQFLETHSTPDRPD